MKLYTNPASPFGRKVKVTAIEKGLYERTDRIDRAVSPVAPDADVAGANPLGKIPCLITDDGQALYDSRVICEFLDQIGDGATLFPADGERRWRVLTLQALGDGIMDAGVAARYETFLRPEPLRWAAWRDGQKAKVARGLDRLEATADELTDLADIGAIAVACAVGYLDFRFAADAWREGRPRLAAWIAGLKDRPSLTATVPA